MSVSMWEILLYGLAIYGAVTIWMLVVQRLSWWHRGALKEIHLIILLHDSEQNLEWIYRSLQWMSATTGQPITITFIDSGSRDDTLHILQRLSRRDYNISIMKHSEVAEDLVARVAREEVHSSPTILIDLRNRCEA